MSESSRNGERIDATVVGCINGSSSSSSSSSCDDDSSSSSWGSQPADGVATERSSNQQRQEDAHWLDPVHVGSTCRERHFSFEEHTRESVHEDSQPDIPSAPMPSAGGAASVPHDHDERQLLLLMLLAQVCALHDPTPRTFTVHVLELFERGLLDRSSIRFLFDLGLVPATASPPALLPQPTNHKSDSLALVPAHGSTDHINYDQQHHRSREASAIRTKLETLERQHQRLASPQQQSVPAKKQQQQPQHPRPWSVDAHPLSLSRYQREFNQVGLLASGAFGHVFQAQNKMDGRDYAIKRVAFSAQGYSKDSLQQVVREVHCLAVCDHPNVVRYFTSWLEPSWMTGSGTTTSTSRNSSRGNSHADRKQRHKLLTDIQRMVTGGSASDVENLSNDLRDYFKDPLLSSSSGGGRRHRRRYSEDSFDADESLDPGEYSEWTVDQNEYSKDDFFVCRRPSRRRGSHRYLSSRQQFDAWDAKPSAIRQQQSSSPEKHHKYSYQICLFIQMQLCHPKTLADWIRERNQKQSHQSIASRIDAAAQIFVQIACGLSHVHQKGIIHRDLKPANCFTCIEDGFTFKIGDFGLSRLIESVSHPPHETRQRGSSAAHSAKKIPLLLEFYHTDQTKQTAANNSTWKDPMTAGVGTASYAAPEQVSSRSYGTRADVYSLGLILLELLCCFSTEHERLQTFRNCREQRTLPDELEAYPIAAQTILACTERDPRARPSAESLTGVNLCQTVHAASCRKVPPLTYTEQESLIRSLREQLQEKDSALEQCQQQLAEKDGIIVDLRRQLNASMPPHRPPKRPVFSDELLSEPASSSSEDEL